MDGLEMLKNLLSSLDLDGYIEICMGYFSMRGRGTSSARAEAVYKSCINSTFYANLLHSVLCVWLSFASHSYQTYIIHFPTNLQTRQSVTSCPLKYLACSIWMYFHRFVGVN